MTEIDPRRLLPSHAVSDGLERVISQSFADLADCLNGRCYRGAYAATDRVVADALDRSSASGQATNEAAEQLNNVWPVLWKAVNG